MTFVRRLYLLIQDRGFTFASVATEVGLSRSSLSRILSGRFDPRLSFILRILAFLRPTPNELYFLVFGNPEELP